MMSNYGNFQQQPYDSSRSRQGPPLQGQPPPWNGQISHNGGGGGGNAGPAGWGHGAPNMGYSPQQQGIPQVQLQAHHWNAHPQQGSMYGHGHSGPVQPHGMHLMMNPQQFHYQQQQQQHHFNPYQQYSGHQRPQNMQGRGGRGGSRRPQGHHQQSQQHQQQQQFMNNGSDHTAPNLALPPAKRQRKKDIVPPLEIVTENAVVREPQNDAERTEIETWKAERRRHWPSEQNVQKKAQEGAARHARGEVDPDDARTRLQDILAKQRAMGLSKKAGTEDLYFEVAQGGGSNRGRGRGRGGSAFGNSRGRGGRGGRGGGERGRGRQAYGWEALMDTTSEMPLGDPEYYAHQQHREKEKDVDAAQAQAHVSEDGPTEELKLLEGVSAPGKRREPDTDAPTEVLAALQGYGSDSETAAAAEEAGEVAVPKSECVDVPERAVRFEMPGERGRGRGRGRERGRGRGRGRGNGQQREPWRPPPRPKDPSLLEKLLADEIRQDRSYILQAFRFFVTNNYLLDYASGTPLVFPAAAPEAAEEPAQQAPLPALSAHDILKSKEGVDIEISDSEDEGHEGDEPAVPSDSDDDGSGEDSSEEEEEEDPGSLSTDDE